MGAGGGGGGEREGETEVCLACRAMIAWPWMINCIFVVRKGVGG